MNLQCSGIVPRNIISPFINIVADNISSYYYYYLIIKHNIMRFLKIYIPKFKIIWKKKKMTYYLYYKIHINNPNSRTKSFKTF